MESGRVNWCPDEAYDFVPAGLLSQRSLASSGFFNFRFYTFYSSFDITIADCIMTVFSIDAAYTPMLCPIRSYLFLKLSSHTVTGNFVNRDVWILVILIF